MIGRYFDNDNMHWRVRQIDRIAKKLKWYLKYRFSHPITHEAKQLSMVVVGRNDNYGGDFSARLQTTIDWNYNQVPGCELIYVEWNPMPDRPSDTEWISQRYPNSKCFIVPTSIHQAYCTSPKMPVMEYFAKNLGIREASNEWVMCVNADVFLGPDTLEKISHLNKEYVYGTHYKNIEWHGEPITLDLIKDESRLKNQFSTDRLEAVAGNFVLTHKDNWAKSTGYDETLTDVRLGVDKNGLKQLFYHGVKPMVIGTHYHLDHAESAIKGSNNQTHGNQLKIKNALNIPYKNSNNWGLQQYQKVQIADKVWVLKEI